MYNTVSEEYGIVNLFFQNRLDNLEGIMAQIGGFSCLRQGSYAKMDNGCELGVNYAPSSDSHRETVSNARAVFPKIRSKTSSGRINYMLCVYFDGDSENGLYAEFDPLVNRLAAILREQDQEVIVVYEGSDAHYYIKNPTEHQKRIAAERKKGMGKDNNKKKAKSGTKTKTKA